MYKYVVLSSAGAAGGSFLFNLLDGNFNHNGKLKINNIGLYLGLGIGCLYAYKIQK